ncbi:50S ribosomal protein L29 [bacterium]|nr:50S ribosomal protein L29 [bacterium]
MKAHEIREKTLDDIRSDVLAAEENLRTLKFQLVTSQLENTSAIKRAKKDLARLKTVLREQERSEAAAHAGGGE